MFTRASMTAMARRLLPLDGGLKRAPQPLTRYKLHAHVWPQVFDLRLDPDRPLLAVDADEVLVLFAAHFGELAAREGFRFRLTSYSLSGALRRADGSPASETEFRRLFDLFFEQETIRQRAAGGAAEALEDLAREAQVVILTNAPLYARDDRAENLRGLGMDYPMVVNIGGKGAALRYLWDHTTAPVVFIDDSPSQLGSAKRAAPGVTRLHFVADPDLRPLADPGDTAHASARDWDHLTKLARRALTRRD